VLDNQANFISEQLEV